MDNAGARGRLHSPRGYRSPQQLAGQVSDLKLQLAKRDAEVEFLEGQLAEAVAATRPQPTPQSDASHIEVSVNEVTVLHLHDWEQSRCERS